jgi:MFS family permease
MKNNEIKGWVRWLALLIASLAMFGNYYLYDSVAYVAKDFMDNLKFSQEDFGLFYTMYSIAAVIALIFGGIFIDKFGTRISILLFGAICAIAGFVTAISPNLYIMLTGRFLLGFGAEPLIVAITVAIAKWFKGKELGLALGINLFIARAGQYAVDWSPTWGKKVYALGWQPALYMAAAIGTLCLIGGIAYYYIEWRTQKKHILGSSQETEKLDFSSMFSFSKSYWFIVILCVTFYSAIFPFRGFAPTFFQEAHGTSKQLAGQLNSIVILAAMFATPIIGLLIDKFGKRASIMFLGSIVILPVYLMMAYSHLPLYIPIGMMGISFSLIPAVMWPSVAYIVDEKKLGKAYAFMTLVQQIGVAFFAYLIGWANEYSKASETNPAGYNLGMWMFSAFGIAGLIFTYFLRKVERSPKGHGLEKAKLN